MELRAETQKRIGYGDRMAIRRGKSQAYAKEEEQGMKKQGKKIEVRFFESAEFHVTPTETWIDGEDCGERRE